MRSRATARLADHAFACDSAAVIKLLGADADIQQTKPAERRGRNDHCRPGKCEAQERHRRDAEKLSQDYIAYAIGGICQEADQNEDIVDIGRNENGCGRQDRRRQRHNATPSLARASLPYCRAIATRIASSGETR
jgi:hypothetical protein